MWVRPATASSPDSSGRWLETVSRERCLAVSADEKIEKGPRQRGLPGAGDDSDGIQHRAIRVLPRPERLLHLQAADGGIRRVNERGVDLSTRGVVEGLTDVRGEHELRLQPIPEAEGLETFLRVLTGRHRRLIAHGNLRHSGV